MCRFELGRFPLYIRVYKLCTKYWYRLEYNCYDNKLLGKAYELCKKENHTCYSGFNHFLKLNGLASYMNTRNMSVNFLANTVERRLRDQYIQSWYNNLSCTAVYPYLNLLKEEYNVSLFLLSDDIKLKTRSNIVKLRQGYFSKKFKNDNVCELCNETQPDIIKHVLLECCKLSHHRSNFENLITKYVNNYSSKSSLEKVIFVMKCEGNANIRNTIHSFIDNVFKTIDQLNE